MAKTYIVDGNSLLFRSFYAGYYPGSTIMRSRNGTPTNAIFTFHNMMAKLKKELGEGDHLFVAFDTGKKTFRAKEMDEYKTQRKPLEPDLAIQLPIAREMLDALNIYHYELDGFEGDDVAGTAAKYAGSLGDEVRIFTSDKDFLQLLDDNISVYFLRKGLSEIEIFTCDNILEKMGITASQIKDYKGLVGDPSDNLKGIPGVGEKTAIKLLKEYGTLENIIFEMSTIDTKTAKNIVEHKQEGIKCKYMATIILDLEIKEQYASSIFIENDSEKQYDFYLKYDLNSFAKNLNYHDKPLDEKPNVNIPTSIKLSEVVRFDDIKKTVTTLIPLLSEKNYQKASILGIYYGTKNEVFYQSYCNIIIDDSFSKVSALPSISTFDSKLLYVTLHRLGVTLNNITFDLLLASYLLNSNLQTDFATIYEYFGYTLLSDQDSLFEDDSKYVKITHYLSLMHDEVIEKLQAIDCLKLFTDLELPLAIVLANLEIEGFPVSLSSLQECSRDFKEKLASITDEIYELAGYSFNLNSPRLVADLLFNKLSLPRIHKDSTSIEVLNSLSHRNPIIPLIITQRKFQKLISGYTESLQNHIFPDNKLHCIFNQALTTTGRLSASEPNLQNISVRSEEGKELRKAFLYEKDYEMLSLDYSQIELRVLASMSSCTPLIDIFLSGEDVHKATAAKIFNIPLEQVSSEQRRKAKTINFGIVYGISDWGLAEQLNISAQEAHSFTASFKNTFPELALYNAEVLKFAAENGYVKTYFGRRRYVEELRSSSRNIAEFGKRAAINATIQGTAADIIKIAMIKVDKCLKEGQFKTKLILTIHDELIFKVPFDEKEIVYPLIKQAMEECVTMKVKLSTEGSFGKTWFDAK